MNRFINCQAIDCGIGFSFGEGVQASLHGCHAVGNNIGDQLHENSDIQMTISAAKKNNIGVDIVGRGGDQRTNIRQRSYAPSPVRYGYSSYEISYAVAYLTHIVGYNPFE